MWIMTESLLMIYTNQADGELGQAEGYMGI